MTDFDGMSVELPEPDLSSLDEVMSRFEWIDAHTIEVEPGYLIYDYREEHYRERPRYYTWRQINKIAAMKAFL